METEYPYFELISVIQDLGIIKKVSVKLI